MAQTLQARCLGLQHGFEAFDHGIHRQNQGLQLRHIRQRHGDESPLAQGLGLLRYRQQGFAQAPQHQGGQDAGQQGGRSGRQCRLHRRIPQRLVCKAAVAAQLNAAGFCPARCDFGLPNGCSDRQQVHEPRGRLGGRRYALALGQGRALRIQDANLFVVAAVKEGGDKQGRFDRIRLVHAEHQGQRDRVVVVFQRQLRSQVIACAQHRRQQCAAQRKRHAGDGG